MVRRARASGALRCSVEFIPELETLGIPASMMRGLQPKGNVHPLLVEFLNLALSTGYEEHRKYFRNPLLYMNFTELRYFWTAARPRAGFRSQPHAVELKTKNPAEGGRSSFNFRLVYLAFITASTSSGVCGRSFVICTRFPCWST